VSAVVRPIFPPTKNITYQQSYLPAITTMELWQRSLLFSSSMVVMPRSNGCLSVLFLPALCATKNQKVKRRVQSYFFSTEKYVQMKNKKVVD
jgi:hypothetical protein